MNCIISWKHFRWAGERVLKSGLTDYSEVFIHDICGHTFTNIRLSLLSPSGYSLAAEVSAWDKSLAAEGIIARKESKLS